MTSFSPYQQRLIAIAHTPRPKVGDVSELTPEQTELTKQAKLAFRQLMNDLVIADARASDDNTWQPIYDPVKAALHCEKCSGMVLGAAISIIADLAYKADPEMSRENFLERYPELVGDGHPQHSE